MYRGQKDKWGVLFLLNTNKLTILNIFNEHLEYLQNK